MRRSSASDFPPVCSSFSLCRAFGTQFTHKVAACGLRLVVSVVWFYVWSLAHGQDRQSDFVPVPSGAGSHRWKTVSTARFCVGAHEKLTTCAQIELTTPKTGFATRHAAERCVCIRAARVTRFFCTRLLMSISSRAAKPRGGGPRNARYKGWLGGQLLVSRGGSFLVSAEGSICSGRLDKPTVQGVV